MSKELLSHISKVLSSAELVYNSKDYTSATILYFKVIFAITDYILLTTTGKSAKDHAERFRLLEKHEPELYTFLDNYFRIYRNTYSLTIDKNTCNEVRTHVFKIIKTYKIPTDN